MEGTWNIPKRNAAPKAPRKKLSFDTQGLQGKLEIFPLGTSGDFLVVAQEGNFQPRFGVDFARGGGSS